MVVLIQRLSGDEDTEGEGRGHTEASPVGRGAGGMGPGRSLAHSRGVIPPAGRESPRTSPCSEAGSRPGPRRDPEPQDVSP